MRVNQARKNETALGGSDRECELFIFVLQTVRIATGKRHDAK